MNCVQVWAYGRNVFMGYLLNDKETRDAFNEDNWLRLGEKDVGYVDDDGFNVFLGRPRNYITLKSGEVICPNRLEQLVRLELPCVKHAMIVGDGQEWLAVLLTLRTRPSLGVHGQQTQYDRLTPLWIVRFCWDFPCQFDFLCVALVTWKKCTGRARL